MKTAFGILTMAVACTLGGCANNGTPNMFSAGFWQRDPNTAAVNEQLVRNDKRPITQTQYSYNPGTMSAAEYNATHAVSGYTTYSAASADHTGMSHAGMNHAGMNHAGMNHTTHDMNRADYSVTGPRRAPGMPNDATSGTVMNDTQLQHGTDKTRISAALNSQDQQFVLDAGSGGLYEVQSSQKALAKSQDGRVRTLAQHMINDHTKANNALMALAQRKGVPAAAIVPNAHHIGMLQRLDTLNGTDFDREYMTQQRAAHTESIAKYQAQANNGFDRDLRDFAASTLPTLRGHLDMINNNNTNNNIGNER